MADPTYLSQCALFVYTFTEKTYSLELVLLRCTHSGQATWRAGETQNRDLGFSSPAMMPRTTPACPLSPGALFLLALTADKCD